MIAPDQLNDRRCSQTDHVVLRFIIRASRKVAEDDSHASQTLRVHALPSHLFTRQPPATTPTPTAREKATVRPAHYSHSVYHHKVYYPEETTPADHPALALQPNNHAAYTPFLLTPFTNTSPASRPPCLSPFKARTRSLPHSYKDAHANYPRGPVYPLPRPASCHGSPAHHSGDLGRDKGFGEDGRGRSRPGRCSFILYFQSEHSSLPAITGSSHPYNFLGCSQGRCRSRSRRLGNGRLRSLVTLRTRVLHTTHIYSIFYLIPIPTTDCTHASYLGFYA